MPLTENTGYDCRGFEIDQEEEVYLTALSRQISAGLSHLPFDINMPPLDRYRHFINQLKTIWPDNDGHRVKPRFKLRGFGDASIKFELYN